MKFKISAAAVLMAGALTLTGCYNPDDGGVTGKVVDKDKKVKKSQRGKYELDVVDANGVEHEFYVNEDTYDKCFRGSSYPKCKNR